MAAFKVVSRLSYANDAIRFGDTQVLTLKQRGILFCPSDVTSYAVTRLGVRLIRSSIRCLSLKIMTPHTSLTLVLLLMRSLARFNDKMNNM